MITGQQIAWAAGIFEGEGHCRYKPNGNRPPRHNTNSGTQCAIVVQKDPWLLYKLQEMFGFGRVAKVNKGKGTSCYTWACHGANARGFLMTIYFFLSPRRQAQVKACKFLNLEAVCQS